MPGPEYRFVTEWRAPGTVAEVSGVLRKLEELPRWWPAVYLEARSIDPGQEDGVGRRVALRTKGFLPYTLTWELLLTESRPDGFSVRAEGDLSGTGDWRFEPAGAWTLVTYDWRVRAEKPLLRVFTPLLRPLFSANHRWAMRTGETSLMRELARRRAATPEERARIPPAPRPAAIPPLGIVGGGLVVGAVAYGIFRLISRRRRRRRRRRPGSFRR